ncbi:MAG: hypothetical protein LBU46_00790, partial [Candidatus Accumulibacter sp.]|nr:hypothetical protein [Accumulibacter sp.]
SRYLRLPRVDRSEGVPPSERESRAGRPRSQWERPYTAVLEICNSAPDAARRRLHAQTTISSLDPLP